MPDPATLTDLPPDAVVLVIAGLELTRADLDAYAREWPAWCDGLLFPDESAE